MNQNRITNQILEQKNFTLNSTLNYLFNISNMKKLFSYLLISSMVVLSSCTNYDDQFDDLNSQINSLKSQIEGFSSLSSGLTALQGTVSSLQSAVAALPKTATPATDISGLEASVAALQTSLASASTSAEVAAITTQLTAAQAALATAIAANGTAAETNATDIAELQTSLEAVSATLAELKTALAGASTTAEVAALTTSLAAVQADLTDLLAANNIYTPSGTFEIKTAAQLTFAEGLGSKLGIINGDVDVKQIDDMDATKLAAVLAKIKTVTKSLKYLAKGTSITPTAGFTNLTSVGTTLDVDADGDISFPKLASAGVTTLTANAQTTSVSFPALTTVSSLTGSSLNTLSFTGATSFNMGALKRYTNEALSITIKSGLVNLDALVSTDEDGDDQVTDLTVNGATELSIDSLAKGEIDANKITEAKFPLWEGHPDSVMPKVVTAVLPSITPDTADENYNLTGMFENATSVHIIGATKASTPLKTEYVSVTAVGHADLTTLILDGVLASVTVTGSADVNDITLTGKVTTVDIQDTAVVSMDLGYTSAKSGATNLTSYNGSLTIKNNEDMTSFTADKVDDIVNLTIEDNDSLETISMDALDSLGSSATGTSSSVRILENELTASNFQLPSDKDAVPVVEGKITSTSGLNSLQTYIDKAIATTGSVSFVEYDEITKYTTSAGVVHEVNGVESGAPAKVTYATSKSITPGTPGEDFTIVDIYGGVAETYNDPVYQTNTMVIEDPNTTSIASTSIFSFNPGGSGESALTVETTTAFQNGITDFDADEIETYLPEIADALQAKIDAAGYDYTIDAYNDYGATAAYTLSLLSTSGLADNNVLSASGVIFVKVGNDTYVTSTVSSTIAVSATALAEAVVRAINEGALSNTFTATSNSNNIVTLTKQTSATNTAQDLDYVAYPDMTFGGYITDTETSAIPMSYTARQVKAITKGWRITAVNTNVDVNAANLEADQIFFTETAGGDNFTVTAVGDAGQYAQSTATLQIPFSEATLATPKGTEAPKRSTDFTAWM